MNRSNILNLSYSSTIGIYANKVDNISDNELIRANGVNGNDFQPTGIFIDDSQNITGINSITLQQSITNPGGSDTLWISSVNNHLYRGSVDLEDIIQTQTVSQVFYVDAGATERTITIEFTKIGVTVIAVVKQYKGDLANATYLFKGTGAIPSGYVPSANASCHFPAVSGGVVDNDIPGYAEFKSNGSIEIHREANDANTFATTGGWDTFSCSWTIT